MFFLYWIINKELFRCIVVAASAFMVTSSDYFVYRLASIAVQIINE